MTELAILVPVLGRPDHVKPLLDSINETCEARTLFIADPDDAPELEALEEATADYITYEANYAQKIAEGVRVTDHPLLFLGADDLCFKPGWFEAAKAELKDGVEVVGVNDLIPRRRDHQTHFLLTRYYAEQPTIDGGPGPLHEGYCHWNCDDELIATAKHRGVYAYAKDSHVEHLHHMNRKAPDDATYQKGRENWRLDHQIFNRRSSLWAST